MFNDFLTTEGERLLAKSIAGTATITFTKMELGDGDRGTASKNITSLESKRMTLDIYSVLLSGDNHVTITSILKSENIETGFYFREKAVYATDGTTEILFMYGTAGSLAEWLENSNTSVFERTIRTIIAFSDGDNINVTIQGGAYASGEDARNILAAIQNGDWAKYVQAESILSLLDNFVAAYTVARASKLDNLDALDAMISSRAPANTALSKAIWTDARAGMLDRLGYIDNYMSSRAPADTALSNAVWTNTRAGYLDLLASGSCGLNAIMSLLYRLDSKTNICYASETLQESYVTTPVIRQFTNESNNNVTLFRKALKWIAPYDGTVKYSVEYAVLYPTTPVTSGSAYQPSAGIRLSATDTTKIFDYTEIFSGEGYEMSTTPQGDNIIYKDISVYGAAAGTLGAYQTLSGAITVKKGAVYNLYLSLFTYGKQTVQGGVRNFNLYYDII